MQYPAERSVFSVHDNDNVLVLPFHRSNRAGGLPALWRRKEQALVGTDQRMKALQVDQATASQFVRWRLPAACQTAARETWVLKTAAMTPTARPLRASGRHVPPTRATGTCLPHHPPPPSLRPLRLSPPHLLLHRLPQGKAALWNS